ncbi:Scr1 family TA system antitoxin-like transcriptional regulator [Amycolatopsis anabasis]|uniref:Scr1 family TA system antitoxin-like transcriptional regulator n=1 Tax=Amycolatopsis anabasis TaxID=1840409 RepID=UPI001FE5EEBF|nr:Scr1 family TA system antitoxin-like transcriptional regulator [Amycolatopsis anabasis]
MPGLLQTETYMRTVFDSARDPFTGKRLENEVAVRLQTVQVIPQNVGPHSGLYSNFIIVDFEDPEEPGLVYLEYGFGSMQLEKPRDIRAGRLLFDHFTDLGLDEQDSISLIREVAAER